MSGTCRGQRRCHAWASRAPALREAQCLDYLPTMTSDAFIIANTSSPTLRPATASLVIEAVTIDPCPISMLTCDVVAPGVTATPEATGTPSRTNIQAIGALDPDVLIFRSPGMRQVVADSPQWRALRAIREHHAYVAPDVPFGWLDEPPSINRLLGLAMLNVSGSAAALRPAAAVGLAASFNATVYGRAPTAQQLDAVRESLMPLAP